MQHSKSMMDHQNTVPSQQFEMVALTLFLAFTMILRNKQTHHAPFHPFPCARLFQLRQSTWTRSPPESASQSKPAPCPEIDRLGCDDMRVLSLVFSRVLFMQAFVTRGIGKCCGALWIGASNSRSEQVRAVQSDRALVRCGSPSIRCREARRSPAAHSRESPRRPFCNSSGRGVIA